MLLIDSMVSYCQTAHGKDYAISSLAADLAKKEGVKLEDLAGIGSGEGKKILVYDVHRYLHPPQFKAYGIAKKLSTHLKASDLDKAFEKSFGGKQAQTEKAAKGTPDDNAKKTASADSKSGFSYVIPARRGPPRKKGEVIINKFSLLDSQMSQ